jgi:two-component sensor histidine kinase/CheY-like chemotaxis protein
MRINGKTLLLVEDEPVIALGEIYTLRGEGFEVIHAKTGEEAIGIIAGGAAIDLVLMDINLGPGMDGTEAARLILAACDLPVVFLSAHTEKEVVERIDGVTNYGYIVKNLGPTVLLSAIKMAFRLHEARLELERALLEQRRVDALLEERLREMGRPLGQDGLSRPLFDGFPVALLEAELSAPRRRMAGLEAPGAAGLEARPGEAEPVIILRANEAFRRLLGLGEEGVGAGPEGFREPKLEGLRRGLSRLASGDPGRPAIIECEGGAGHLVLKAALALPPGQEEDWSHALVALVDVTEEKEAERRQERGLRDKELLMKELEHRVKNSMGLISSILSLESDRLPDTAARRVLADARERVQTVSSIYDLLSRSAETGCLDSRIQFEELARLFRETYLEKGRGIAIETAVESHPIGVRQSVSLGLIINELLTNAAKYAFPGGRGGVIRLGLRLEGDRIVIIVSDDGVGLPPGFDPATAGSAAGTGDQGAAGLGLRLVGLLAEELCATFSLGPGAGDRAGDRAAGSGQGGASGGATGGAGGKDLGAGRAGLVARLEVPLVRLTPSPPREESTTV